MSDTLTIRELRDLLNNLPALDGDYTNVEEVHVRCQIVRFHLIVPFDGQHLTDENRSLIKANSQLRTDITAKQKEFDRIKQRLAAIRLQVRSRKPNLP